MQPATAAHPAQSLTSNHICRSFHIPHPRAQSTCGAGNFYLNVCALLDELELEFQRGVGGVHSSSSAKQGLCGCQMLESLDGPLVLSRSMGWLVVASCLLLGHSSGDILIYPSEKTNFAALNQC